MKAVEEYEDPPIFQQSDVKSYLSWFDQLGTTLDNIYHGGCRATIEAQIDCEDVVSQAFHQVENRIGMLLKSLCLKK